MALAADSSYLEAGFVLKALLDDQNSGAAALLAHAGVNVPQVKQRLQQHLNSLPKVSGQGGDILPSRELQAVLNLMDKAATKRGDAYIASELFLLALVQQNECDRQNPERSRSDRTKHQCRDRRGTRRTKRERC